MCVCVCVCVCVCCLIYFCLSISLQTYLPTYFIISTRKYKKTQIKSV